MSAEAKTYWEELQAERDRLQAQRDALLELARYLVKRQKEDRNVTYVLAVEMAKSAIALCEKA